MNPDEEIIEAYLNGEEIDPCEYSQMSVEKLNEFLGNDEE